MNEATPARPFPDGLQFCREHPGAAALAGFPSHYAGETYFDHHADGPLCYRVNGDPYVCYFDLRPYVYQDGGQFYRDDDIGGTVADYGEMVSGDFDTVGARAARDRFQQEHGHAFRFARTEDAAFYQGYRELKENFKR